MTVSLHRYQSSQHGKWIVCTELTEVGVSFTDMRNYMRNYIRNYIQWCQHHANSDSSSRSEWTHSLRATCAAINFFTPCSFMYSWCRSCVWIHICQVQSCSIAKSLKDVMSHCTLPHSSLRDTDGCTLHRLVPSPHDCPISMGFACPKHRVENFRRGWGAWLLNVCWTVLINSGQRVQFVA